MNNTSETMKIFLTTNEQYLLPDIEEVIEQDKNAMPETEDPLPVHVIPDDGESVRHNEKNINASEYKYLQKATGTDT